MARGDISVGPQEHEILVYENNPLTGIQFQQALEGSEKLVNEEIQKAILVKKKIMSKKEADKLGAEHEFGAKYPDTVSVYIIGSSIEFCGGPHAANTGELGRFKIVKEEASSSGVRRIKAALE